MSRTTNGDLDQKLNHILDKLSRIQRTLRTLVAMEAEDMATRDDIKQQIEAMRADAAANADAAQAASDALHRLLDMIAGAVGTAQDLEELKAALGEIDTQMRGSTETLGKAIAEVPAAPTA